MLAPSRVFARFGTEMFPRTDDIDRRPPSAFWEACGEIGRIDDSVLHVTCTPLPHFITIVPVESLSSASTVWANGGDAIFFNGDTGRWGTRGVDIAERFEAREFAGWGSDCCFPCFWYFRKRAIMSFISWKFAVFDCSCLTTSLTKGCYTWGDSPAQTVSSMSADGRCFGSFSRHFPTKSTKSFDHRPSLCRRGAGRFGIIKTAYDRVAWREIRAWDGGWSKEERLPLARSLWCRETRYPPTHEMMCTTWRGSCTPTLESPQVPSKTACR